MTAETLLQLIKAKGVVSNDLRDAVHEASHALELGADDWGDRECIHECFDGMRPGDVLQEEILARATEWEAMERFGLEYDPEHWAFIAAMELIKGSRIGGAHPSRFVAGMKGARASGEAARRLDRLIEHVTGALATTTR